MRDRPQVQLKEGPESPFPDDIQGSHGIIIGSTRRRTRHNTQLFHRVMLTDRTGHVEILCRETEVILL